MPAYRFLWVFHASIKKQSFIVISSFVITIVMFSKSFLRLFVLVVMIVYCCLMFLSLRS